MQISEETGGNLLSMNKRVKTGKTQFLPLSRQFRCRAYGEIGC